MLKLFSIRKKSIKQKFIPFPSKRYKKSCIKVGINHEDLVGKDIIFNSKPHNIMFLISLLKKHTKKQNTKAMVLCSVLHSYNLMLMD